MPALVVNQGLQRSGRNTSNVGTAPGTGLSGQRWLQTLSVDDSAVTILAAHTAANSGGAVTNFFDRAIDAANSIASQTVTHLSTLASGEGNFIIRRVILHDDIPSTVSSSSATVHSGIDGHSLTKTSDFALGFTITHLYSNV
jgi:hypothetical protein